MLECSAALKAALLLSTALLCSSNSRSTEDLLIKDPESMKPSIGPLEPSSFAELQTVPTKNEQKQNPEEAFRTSKIKEALQERKAFHKLFENCVVGIGVRDERLFLKHLEECVYVRSTKKGKQYRYLDAETTTAEPPSNDSGQEDDTLPDEVTETVYDNFGRQFVHLYVPGYGEALIRREKRQLREHEKPTPRPKPTTTTKKSVTSKSDIVVGEDRKRVRAKGLWGK